MVISEAALTVPEPVKLISYGFSLPVASSFAILILAVFAPWLVGLKVTVNVVVPAAATDEPIEV